ncbi:MAG: hypothetical protein JWN72_196 [Thermoleophilia bacterium]|nr:hypothetical protein [Thermoleophilia bacterium]
MDDGTVNDMANWNEDRDASLQSNHDQVGTVEVQILLSWFFETSAPGEFAEERRAA